MRDVFIVGAVRSAVGARRGGLSALHPADLGAHVVRELMVRTGAPGEAVDDLILGCVSQIGAQSTNLARIVGLSAGLPIEVPGTTIDRQCGSSQQAVHFAAQAIKSGEMEVVIAAGVEVMSLITIGAAAHVGVEAGLKHPRAGALWADRFGEQEFSQFKGAEQIARQWDISRADMEAYAVESHRRATAAREVLAEEIVSIEGVGQDETPRPGTTAEKLQSLRPLSEDGLLTAATASPISDGAAALMLASAEAVERYGLVPLARIKAMSVVGSDPVLMLTGPIPATEKVLAAADLALGDIDVFEVNEAFASIPLAWLRSTGADPERTNPLGGALSLGHPLGATGARLMTTMVHHLRRSGGTFALQTMCEGGGMANATILERVS